MKESDRTQASHLNYHKQSRGSSNGAGGGLGLQITAVLIEDPSPGPRIYKAAHSSCTSRSRGSDSLLLALADPYMAYIYAGKMLMHLK